MKTNKKSAAIEQRNASLLARVAELEGALSDLLGQAHAQFAVGDRHATFNRQTIAQARATLAAGEKGGAK